MPQVEIDAADLTQVRKQMRSIEEIAQDLPELTFSETLPIPAYVIEVKSHFFNWASGASQLLTYSPYETVVRIMRENAELRLENRKLAAMSADLEKRMSVLESKLPEEENVIVLREISRDEAKAEIAKLFSQGETLYYSDIAMKLRLDLELVVDICNELMTEGEISVADST
jgi:regulator of replication initiation timing